MKLFTSLTLAFFLAPASSAAPSGAFDDCGVLIQGVTCPLLFQADSGGLFLSDANFSAAGLVAGDRLRLVGDLEPNCVSICQQNNGCIFQSQILPDNCAPNSVGTSYCGPAIANSTGVPGTILATGSAVVADDDLSLVASNLPNGQFGYFLVSADQGFSPAPGQGTLCLSGNIGRFSSQVALSNNGMLSIDVDLTALPLNPAVAAMPGDTYHFQCWHRDAQQPSTPPTNFTDGVSVTFS